MTPPTGKDAAAMAAPAAVPGFSASLTLLTSPVVPDAQEPTFRQAPTQLIEKNDATAPNGRGPWPDGQGYLSEALRRQVLMLARDGGFDLMGIARPGPIAHPEQYSQMIAAGGHGQMQYLADTLRQRLDSQAAFPWAKSIICLGVSYFCPDAGDGVGVGLEHSSAKEVHAAGTHRGAASPVARYAWGRDYHRVLKGLMNKLVRAIGELLQKDFLAKVCVDTAPLHERDLARAAGLGWIGKNTLLVNPRHGSWFVLGEIITDLPLEPDVPERDHCGTCTRCIDACPTQALTPYKLDALKCISYQTLENRGEIPTELHGTMQQAGYLVGCDICQDVCPYNRRPLVTREAGFKAGPPRFEPAAIVQWDQAEWDRATRGKAYRRAKLAMWQRNVKIVHQGDCPPAVTTAVSRLDE